MTEHRKTSQRRAIREVFEASDRPLSTEEVLAGAQERKSGLGIATVYRTLKLLVEEGWLRTVVLPGMPPRYERADQPPHHHFYCSQCSRAYRVPCCQALVDTIVPPGFRIAGHDLVLYGTCAACAGSVSGTPNPAGASDAVVH